MAIGAGKYDDLCTYVRKKSGGHSAIVVVIGGKRGNGFSCQTNLLGMHLLPDMLRQMADEIETSDPIKRQ